MQQQIENSFVEKDIKQVEKLIDHLIETNKSLAEKGDIPVCMEIVGEAGMGKTSICSQAALKHGMDFVKIQLSQYDDLGDFTGFPSRAFEIEKDGEKQIVKEKVLDLFLNRGWTFTGLDCALNCPPVWLAGKTKPMLVLIDDWTRAQPRFQQAMMEFILFQTYGDNHLPKGSTILLTSNPDNGDYLVNPVDPAMRTRFGTVALKFSIEAWAEWAELNDIDSRCINFFLLNKDIYDPHAPAGSSKKRVNPRSLTLFFKSISTIEDYEDKESLKLIKDCGEMYLTKEVASLFVSFVSGHLDKLPDAKTLLHMSNEKAAEVLSNAIKTKEATNSSIAYVMSTRILSYMKKELVDTGAISKDEVDTLGYLLKIEIFPKDIALNFIKRASNLHKNSFLSWFTDKELRDLILKK